VAKTINNKDLILKTAFILFLQKGYKSVTLNDIIESTNLSKGAIYHYFESKEKILFEVVDKYYFEVLAFDKSIFDNCTFREQVYRVIGLATALYDSIEQIEEHVFEYPIKNFYFFQLECENFDQLREKFKVAADDYRIMVEDLVRDALVKKEIKETLDAEIISYQIIGMIEGMAIHRSTIRNNAKNIMNELYKKVFDSYLNSICLNEK
jgi:AcrR family transcriptional regulator